MDKESLLEEMRADFELLARAYQLAISKGVYFTPYDAFSLAFLPIEKLHEREPLHGWLASGGQYITWELERVIEVLEMC